MSGLLTWLLSWLLRRGPAPAPAPAPMPPAPAPAPAPIPADTDAEVIARVNAYRAAYRLPPMVADGRLTTAAQQHAAFMARVGRMAHEGIGDGTPWSRMRAAGYAFASAAENVAMGQPTVDSVMSAWLGSPGHRANIVGSYQNIGVGMATDAAGQRYWCLDAGSLATGATALPISRGIVQEPQASSVRSHP